MTPEEYGQSARELARRAAMPDAVAARMEAELDQAFEASAAAAEDPALPRSAAARHWLMAALAAAAVIVVAAGGSWLMRRGFVTSNNVTAPPEVRVKADATRVPEVRLKADATGAPEVRLKANRSRRNNLPPVVRPADFVPVPAAARLPQFESGVIVRMELPVTALPAYGVDISPAGSDRPVEADVLLGQDGLARAIRLVNSSRSQQ